MRGKRLLVPLLLVALAGLVAQPAAAASFDSSITEKLIWGLNSWLLAVAIPITVLVEGILVYTVWKFRKSDEPEPTKENRRLEITWTVATMVVLLFVGVASYGVLASENVTVTKDQAQEIMQQEDTVVVEAHGVQWAWEFRYPEHNFSTAGTMRVPANTTIVIVTTSGDVIHSFHVPALGLKQDAIPGQKNYLKTRITETGTYQLYCAEYCGQGHSRMLGTVEVVPKQEYQQWVEERTGGGNQSAGGNQSGGNQSGGNQSISLPA